LRTPKANSGDQIARCVESELGQQEGQDQEPLEALERRRGDETKQQHRQSDVEYETIERQS